MSSKVSVPTLPRTTVGYTGAPTSPSPTGWVCTPCPSSVTWWCSSSLTSGVLWTRMGLRVKMMLQTHHPPYQTPMLPKCHCHITTDVTPNVAPYYTQCYPYIIPISPPMSPPHNPQTPRCHLHIMTGTHDHMRPRFVWRLDNDKNPTRRHVMKVGVCHCPKSQGCRGNKTSYKT